MKESNILNLIVFMLAIFGASFTMMISGYGTDTFQWWTVYICVFSSYLAGVFRS